MKRLMDKSTIITLKQKGNSSRAVAKALGINRKTVARYWNEFCEQIAEIDTADEEGKMHWLKMQSVKEEGRGLLR